MKSPANSVLEHEVDNAALGVCGFILAAGKAAEIAVELGAHLVDAHGAVVELHAGQGHDEHESQQRVEVIGYRLDEQLDAAVARVEVCRDAGDGGCPRGDRGYHADGRGGRVDEICELGAGDAVSISHRPHDRADGQAVEIVVNEDQNAEDEGREYCADAGLDVGLCPAAERRRAAGHIDQRHDYAKQDEEEEDARVFRDGGDEAVVQCGVERADGGEASAEHRADEDADEQRGVCFLGDECEDDCDDWRQKRPEGSVHNMYLQNKKIMNRADTVHDLNIIVGT